MVGKYIKFKGKPGTATTKTKMKLRLTEANKKKFNNLLRKMKLASTDRFDPDVGMEKIKTPDLPYTVNRGGKIKKKKKKSR